MKKLILISLIITAISFSGCAAKNQTSAQTSSNSSGTTSTSTNTTDSSSAANTSTDVTNVALKNPKPVVIAPETVKKNVQEGTKLSAKMSSVDNALNSIGDFNVTDDSGLK